MERKEIAVQDTWDLSGLFADQNQFDAAEAEIRRLLEQAGLRVEAVYDAFTREEPREDSERVYFVARECVKQNG